MTLQEAESIARAQDRKLRHKTWGTWLSASELLGRNVTVFEAISNEWEVEPRTRTVTEGQFRAALLPVLRKWVGAGDVDKCLFELQERIFREGA